MTDKTFKESLRERAEKLIGRIMAEYGDEICLGNGYSAGDALQLYIEKALLQIREEALREAENIANQHIEISRNVGICPSAAEVIRNRIVDLLKEKGA